MPDAWWFPNDHFEQTVVGIDEHDLTDLMGRIHHPEQQRCGIIIISNQLVR